MAECLIKEPKKRLAIITTHPIQYNAPIFKLLEFRNIITLKVFYTWGKDVLKEKFDPGFNRDIEWDIPLLEGYEFEFVENISVKKGSHHYNGINNPNLIRQIQNYSPSAILIYGWAFKSHLNSIRYFHNRIPVLFRGDSHLLDESGLVKSFLRNIFLRWVYSHIDFALYVGKNNADYFMKAGLKTNELIYAPHAIDNNRFACDDDVCVQKAKKMKQQLNIPVQSFVFLFAGKLELKKDPETLIHAFLNAQTTEDVFLVIVGNGPLEDSLKKLGNSSQKVKFMGFQNQTDMPSVYRMADVFVLPSKGPGETWGLAVNEAMAAGVPVIVSNKCGGAYDLIDQSRNGFIFEAGDSNDLTAKINLMVENKQRIEMMGQEARRKIASFCFETVAENIENLLNSFPNKNSR